jgi:hypothetical protein
MNKSEIIIELKKQFSGNEIKLPSHIDFDITDGVLTIFIHRVTTNMQTDYAAFEAWIIACKALLPKYIDLVVLDFNELKKSSELPGNSDTRHYNRFLYRVGNMLKIFPDWFRVAESKVEIVQDFDQWLRTGRNLLNRSKREREDVIGTTKMERQIESWFVYREGKNIICNLWDIDPHKIYNQLPIGVFRDVVSDKSAIFTGGASAIDFWGIGNDSATLHIFELKCKEKRKMGIISELLFYIFAIYDSFISNEAIFYYDSAGRVKDTSDIIAIKNNGTKFEKLNAHILAETLHPLITQEVKNLIADGLARINVGFDTAIYDYPRKELK